MTIIKMFVWIGCVTSDDWKRWGREIKKAFKDLFALIAQMVLG